MLHAMESGQGAAGIGAPHGHRWIIAALGVLGAGGLLVSAELPVGAVGKAVKDELRERGRARVGYAAIARKERLS
jgi:hypothetical protein